MSPLARLPLRLACGTYDRMEALRNGAVQVEGVALTVCPPGEAEAEIRELSLATYLRGKARGDFPFIAIPVFPLRSFCRGLIYVNGRADIARPQDLAGKRIGIARDRDAQSLWIGGLLRHEHGVALDARHFVESDAEALGAKLAAGEIDAAFGLRLPAKEAVRPLFADHAARDRDSWQKSGLFPIMTVLVMPESLHARRPWLAESLFKACEDAKHWCIRQMRFSGALRLMLPWLLDEIDEMDALFGADPWPYGLAANRNTLEMAVRLLQEEGRIDKPIALDPLFTPIIAWAE